MTSIYLISTLLMGVLLIAVAFLVTRSGQRATPAGGAGVSGGQRSYGEWSPQADDASSRLVRLANEPVVWGVTFVTLALVFLAGAVLLIADVSIAGGVLGTAIIAVGAAVLVGYVFFGSYFAARERIGQSAAAVAVASVTIGLVVLLSAVVMLLLA